MAASIPSSSKLAVDDDATQINGSSSSGNGSAMPSAVELLALLSLPRLEATFFRSIAMARPVGPSKHLALVAITQQINATIYGLSQRHRRRQREEQTRRERNDERRARRKKRKAATSRDEGDTKRQKIEGEEHRRASAAASDEEGAGASRPATSEQDQDGDDEQGDDSDDESEQAATDDEDQEEQDEVARLQDRLMSLGHDDISSHRLEMPPAAILHKLAEFYDVEGLDDLVSDRELGCPA